VHFQTQSTKDPRNYNKAALKHSTWLQYYKDL